MKLIATWAWAGAVVFGLILVASGAYMTLQGQDARNDVRDTLSAERIITSKNAETPMKPVTGPAEAKAQADTIRDDALRITGGKTYAELAPDDPNRAVYLQSVTLRTALMQSYMAFKVSDLVTGVGALVAALGIAQIGLGLYLGFVVVRRPQPSVKAAIDPTAAMQTPISRPSVQGR
jgi:hypothetical protein